MSLNNSNNSNNSSYIKKEAAAAASFETLQIHAYNWQVLEQDTHNDRTNILIWALDLNSSPYLLRIEDFPHSCYLELPKYVNNKVYRYTKALGLIFGDKITEYFRFLDKGGVPEKFMYVQKRKLYYYQQNENTHYLQLTFSNKNQMDIFCRRMKNPLILDGVPFHFRVWENDVSIVRKLLTAMQIRYTQWFTVQGKKIVEEASKISTLNNEYLINFRTMRAIDPDISKTFATYPGVLIIDGEMYAQNKKALPNPANTEDVCYMLSCIYQRVSKPETRKCYILLIGTCPAIEGVEIIQCQDEKELGDKYADLVNELDPEIISGYNILGFDNPYLDDRRKGKGPWKVMGRLKNRTPYFYNKAMQSKGAGHNKIVFMVKDGRIEIDFLNIARRELKLEKYNLDNVAEKILGEHKHDVSPQEMFRIYETNRDVCKALRIAEEIGLAESEMKKLRKMHQEIQNEFKKVAEYCVQDSILVIKLFDAWKAWIYLVELGKIQGINIEELFTAGQQKRVFSQIYDLAARTGYVIDKRDLPRVDWAGGFVHEPSPGLYDYVICLDFKSLYPNIIRAFNLCYTTLVPPELMNKIPDHMCHIIEWDEEIDPKDKNNISKDEDAEDAEDIDESEDSEDEDADENGKNNNFKGNNVNNQFNPANGTLKHIESDNKDKNSEGKEKSKKSSKTPKKKVIHYKYKFLKKEYQVGLLPTLVGYLIDERNRVRGEQKALMRKILAFEARIKEGQELTPQELKENHEAEAYYEILEKRQLGLKLTANSMFGTLGVQEGGMLPLVEVAQVITALGRKLIKSCNVYLKENYNACIVYNDTDSTLFVIPSVTNGRDCIDWGHRLAKEVSALFPDPLETEFEKAGRMFSVKKKKYVFWQLYMEDKPKIGAVKGELMPIEKDGLVIRGIVLARRDNCKIQRELYESVLYKILNRAPMQVILDIIMTYLVRILKGYYPIEKFVMIKSINAQYKNDSFSMKIFGDELNKIGKPATPGDRLSYVIVEDRKEKEGDHIREVQVAGIQIVPADLQQSEPLKVTVKKELLGYKMRLPETCIETGEKIDYIYYIEKIIMNCIEQLWSIAFKDEIDKIELPYELEDKMEACHYAANINKNANIKMNELYQEYQGDIMKIYEAMFDTPGLKTHAKKARGACISGRKVFKPRLTKKPIKHFIKAIKLDPTLTHLKNYVKNIMSEEAYKEIEGLF